MDAHKVAIKQAVLLPERREPVEWQLANEKAAGLARTLTRTWSAAGIG
jgi:hypothetical protein